MAKSHSMIKVCVTGGAGFIGSWLVKKLLHKGYIVHATLRNLDDETKVSLLRNLPGAETRLKLFDADIYNPDSFEETIQGCEYVFHVATPLQHNVQSSLYKDTSEAAVAGVKSIVQSCIKSGMVKRLIYTASVLSASAMKEDGTGFKDVINEDCWTPLDFSFSYYDEVTMGYVSSKTLSEKEVLKINETEKGGLEVVTLVCGLVVGDTILSYVSGSQEASLSQLTSNAFSYNHLRLLQEILGSVPLIHVDDVCEAHIFCIEKPSMTGRFLCANVFPTVQQIGKYYQDNYPEIGVEEKFIEGQEMGVQGGSTKLTDIGFEYKYDLKKMLDENVACARRLGRLK
ncbi:hypothetical protein GIB67_042312 [Kingdonia uniflora]|uniref:NAD-dependent epimerase/dehydratase domain-containing protein n=1 Tax=Kingdonia uniflora TaxID=39325 RepID=A0A7J7LEB3_9MAGN|nr:hypothetical protein GIB67_042312 [Kingdonia uniflora]